MTLGGARLASGHSGMKEDKKAYGFTSYNIVELRRRASKGAAKSSAARDAEVVLEVRRQCAKYGSNKQCLRATDWGYQITSWGYGKRMSLSNRARELSFELELVNDKLYIGRKSG